MRQDRRVDERRMLCSTGVFSRDPDLSSIEVVTRGMRQLPDTGFEVMFYPGWYEAPADVSRQVAAVGAETPVLHTEKSIGPGAAASSVDERERAMARFAVNCRVAAANGATRLVLHLWGLPDSDTRFESNLAALPRLLDVAAQHDLSLSVESLLCRLRTPVDAVAACIDADSRAGITLDTAFLAMQDQLDRSVTDDRLWQRTGAVDHVHLKDCADVSVGWGQVGYVHPGEGSLDLRGFLEGLQARGYTGRITLEAPALTADAEPDLERIARSLEWIRGSLRSQ